MLEEIKLLLGITDDTQDTLINLLISQCVYDAQTITGQEKYYYMRPVIVRMVVERYNKIGTEGVNTINTNGISENYINGYSAEIMALLNRYKRIRFY